jgi:hypothetical protein
LFLNLGDLPGLQQAILVVEELALQHQEILGSTEVMVRP